MDCPRCHYHSPFEQTRCPGCYSTFETAALEELGHLHFLHMQLRHWRTNGLLPATGATSALEATERRIATVETTLGLSLPAAPSPQPAQPAPPPAPAVAAAPPAPTPPPVVAAAPPQPTTPPAPAASATPAKPPTPRPTPRADPPRPTRPPFSWGQVGTYLLSERTLNGLLSLGAFLILTSGTVISTINPTHLNAIPHFVSTIITTLLFYLAGIFVRQKLALSRTGSVLLAIGAAFIPLTIWTLGQPQLLNWDRDAIWLIAALVCLPIYLGSHLLLRDRTFALLTALAGGAEIFTILAWLGVPLEWRCCALLLLAMRYLTLADRLRERWPALAWACAWTAQVAVPAILAATLLGHVLPALWTPITGVEADDFFGLAVALAWWLGAAYYALAARRLTGRAYPYIAAWSLPVAFLLTLSEAAVARFWHTTLLADSWHNLALALFALAALAWGRWRQRVLAGEARPTLLAIATRPAYQLALALPLLAALWPAQTLESRVPTLFVLVGLYTLAAWLLRQLPFRAVAAYLLPVAISGALDLSVRPDALSWLYNWHGLVWALVAGGYLLFARLALRAGRADDGSYSYLGLALEPVANTIPLLTVMAMFASPPVTWGQFATLATLALLYGAATFLLRQRAWAWLSVAFLPLAALPAFDLLALSADTRPLAWIGLALAMLVAAEVAAWRTGESRRALLSTVLGLGDWRSRFAAPLFAVGYASGALALVLALGRTVVAPPAGFTWGYFLPRPVLAAFLAIVAALVASTVTRRASRFLYVACALFPLPYAAACALIARDWGLSLADHDAARLLALLGAAYLLAALATDRAGVRFAAPLWLSGYTLVLAMPLFAAADRAATVQTLGLAIILLAASALLAHFDRHPSFDAFVRALSPDPATAEHQTIRALFVYGATWLSPIWALLAMSLRSPAFAVADYGLALALLAPLYVVLGAVFAAIRRAYRWPWYLCGYLLAALGPIVAIPDQTLRVVALGISIGLWTGSAIAWRRAEWLYPVALFIPVLVADLCVQHELPWRYAGLVAVALSLAYIAVGMVLHRGWRRPVGPLSGTISGYALPFFGVGQLLVVLGLALSPLATRELNAATLALVALGYVALGWLSRQSAFAWPATATAAAAYAIGMSLFVSEANYGLGLLPLLFVALVVADLLRHYIDDANPADGTATDDAGPLVAWATPCYAIAYGGSVFAIALSWGDVNTLAFAWWGVAALYALSTALFRHPLSLYPAIGTALAGFVAAAHALAPGLPTAQLLALLVAPAWFLAIIADSIATMRGTAEAETPARWPFLGAERLLADAWAAPPLALALGALILAVVGSAPAAGAGLVAALAGTVLLGLFATRWHGEGEAWGALALTALAFWHLLDLVGMPLSAQSTPWALLALGLTLLAIGVRAVTTTALDPWRRPLAVGTIAYSAWALLLGLANAADTQGQQSFAFTLAISGLTLVAHGFDRRERLLGYIGVAFLEAGYMVHLFVHEIGQPQAFAIPAGLFLLGVAYLEWRRGTGAGIKATLELAAVSLLVSVTTIQALGYLPAGIADRHLYGSFMLVEAALLFILGAALQWRRTFFGGGLGIVLAVGLLLRDPVKSLNNWYLAALIGFIMIALVIFIEQRRQQIPVWLGEWRARLEEWD